MKTPYVRFVYCLAMFTLVLMPTLLAVLGADVPPEKRSGLIFPTLFCATGAGALTIVIAIRFQESVPNGKPRPEDELERGVIYYVDAVAPVSLDARIIIAGVGEETPDNATCWRFTDAGANSVAGLIPGDRFVYLDDPHQLLKWQDDKGVVMLLSEKGRAKASKDSGLSPHMKRHLERSAADARNLS